MPKKAARHAQYARDSAPKDKPKRHRSLHIGPSNGRRWLSLKKRLGLLTDDQLVVYLLDLADSLAAREQESDCKDNDDQSTPVEVFQEQPRRSLRNQLAAANESPKSPHDSEEKAHLRADKPKKHKNKARHHKEKRKKRKHQKIKDEESLDNRLRDSNVPWELDSESDTEKADVRVPDGFTLENEMHQTDGDSEGSFSSSKIEGLQKLCHDTNQLDCYDGKTDLPGDQDLASTTCVQNQRETLVVQNHCATSAEAQSKDGSSKLISSSELSQPAITHSTKVQQDSKDTEDTQIAETDFPNKKYKRSKLESGETCSVLVELDRSYCDELITSIQKRDRKKHKEHQSKKHRDVRKAPQDGIIVTEKDRDVTCSNDSVAMTATTTAEPDDMNTVPSEAIIENPGSETPRLAIKIKLCQECNSRHLQDTCPLSEPQYIIKDSITLEQWAQNNSENVEAMKTLNSNDPMSQGYGKYGDDVFESDEEAAEQYKSKSKQECEEKQERVDVNRPLYARDSLPDCLEFKLSNADHGLGVYVKNSVPMYAQLGPLVGKPIQEMDIPDDFSMRHIWEIDTNNKTLYISTTNPLTSNWIRYVRPAETKDDRNVAVISKNGELCLVTSKSLTPGTELTYWSDSQSTAWTRKNKIDKTNCGGCNLTFAHPIYYRLHCCIFHDTNYSLTIRKYHCKVCGAAVLGKDNIMKHAAQLHAGRGAYQCQYCKKFFLRLNYLEMHRTYGCSQNPQRSRPLCDFCGRKFCQPQKLKVHIKRMHSDMSEVLREFQCKLCLKLLGSRAALQRHMKEVHHKDVVGAATCDRCGKMFQNKSNLKIHMLTHSGVKPFKCKENGCKAAFTTKQCLQFHYKKVHGLSEDAMPKIERSVAYTFDAYSGGLVEDAGRGKIPKFNQNNSQENSDSLASFDDGSSENNNSSSVPVEMPCTTNSEQLQVSEEPGEQISAPVPAQMAPVDSPTGSVESDIDIYGAPRLPSKTSKKWLGEFDPPPCASPPPPNADIYDFQDAGRREEEKLQPPSLIDETKLGLGMFRRTESSNASLLVEAALDAAEREIGAVSSPILEDSDREANLYSIPNELDFKVSNCPPMTIVHRSPLPPSDSHIESYMHEDLVPTSPGIPHSRHSPPGPHAHLDYHLHRPIDYVPGASRTHSIEQYLDQQELQRVIHVSQEVPSSPSRYQEIPHPHSHLIHHHHHQLAVNEALSSDEGDSVAQNLSLPVKEKSLQQQQLEMAKYDGLESEFALVNRERVRFEPLIVQSSSDQGLDMSARGLQQAFGSQVQSHHLHHHHHLYEMSERERQGVDLSRTSACMSPPSYPPPYPPYSHVDVPRVVSLESASRPHHLHTSVSRIIASPQPASSLTSHLVPESLETRNLSPPPPAMSAYNSTYPVGPTPYHTSRSGYHYSGYY